MEHLYDIIIAGHTAHKGLTEGEFFELMEDLSKAHYETGYPDLSIIDHRMYLKE